VGKERASGGTWMRAGTSPMSARRESSDPWLRAWRGGIGRPCVFAGYALVGTFVLALLAMLLLVWSACGADTLRAYTHPDQLADVRVLDADGPARRAPSEPRVVADFDGDGTVDTIEVEYLRREPLFARTTSGMLRVLSGADGSVLAARAVSIPICRETWCGDIDGNGTDDVRFQDEGVTYVLSYAR
jgi:hypothetical protein